MGKVEFKPGNMLYPLPVVLVSSSDGEGHDDVCTIAWAGTINSDPAMVSISVRKSRYTYDLIQKSGDFVINLTTKELVFATDYCGVKSGRDEDKFESMKLTKEKAKLVSAPLIKESPVNIECKVTKSEDLGSHTIFMAEVVAVHADDKYMDENGKFHLEYAHPIVYSHGSYLETGEVLGTFGYSVKKS